MLESLWYEVASRSGGWLAVVAVGALKGAMILAVTALFALSFRRASAAARHQIWLVGVVCALAVPLMGIVLPRFTVPGPAWLADRVWESERMSHAGYDASAEAPMAMVVSSERPATVRARAEASVAAIASRSDELAEHVAALAEARADELAARAEEVAAHTEAVAERAEAAAHAAHAAADVLADVSDRPRSRLADGAVLHALDVVTPSVAALPRLPPVPALPPLPPVSPVPPVSWSVVPAFAPEDFLPAQWSPEEAGGFPWAVLALAVWLLGVWLVSSGIVVGALRVAWIGWQARPVGTGRCATLASAIADELGLRDVRVLLGASTAMPMTWGLLRTTVLLPDGAESWPIDQLDAVLRHELAHARRRDTLTQLIADVGCAIYWFNPLAWAAAFRLRVEREHACDDEVLASGSKPSDYATQLLDMTRALRAARATAMAAIPMARPAQLRDRLEAVLDEDRRRGRLTRPAQVRGWLLGLVLGVPIAMLGFAPVPSFADEYGFDLTRVGDAMMAPFVEESFPHAIARAIDAHAPWPPEHASTLPPGWQECADSRRNNSFSRHVDDDEQRIQWYTDGCRRTVEIVGEIRFDDDYLRIASLPSGTRVRIEAETRRGERAVDIVSVGGAIAYTYSEDGDERPFDEDARAWLDALVLELLRTGYAADERVAALFRRGGVAAVLAEVEHLRTDYARRIYYQAALAEESATPTQAASLIERAGAGIRSDYELAELLIATADDRPFSGGIRDAFIDASASLSSDYERRRVLAVVLARADLTPDNVASVIASASEIRSDYEKTELLVSLSKSDLSSSEVQHAYMSAAASIRSDYERRRALEAILVKHELEPAVTALAIRTAGALRSDHDKAETLLSIARTQRLDDVGRAEFLEAIETLRSDYDHGRVSSALLRSER